MIRPLLLALCLSMFACTPTPIVKPTPTPAQADAELDSAIQQARDSLPTFIETISSPQEDRTLVAVKVRFTPPAESPQDIWVDEVTYSEGVLRGSMGDDIPALHLEFGESILVNEQDIVDWMIVEDGTLIGGYTIRLAMQRMSAEERERFLQSLDYVIED
jgi:uncharacterized protein YegJ (DUF2314 family)